MPHSAKILLDSISPDGDRLTTFEVVFPRIILSEFNTHRVLSRNSASSRAIPVEKMIERVERDPYIPTHWGKNQKGMQAEVEVDAKTAALAKEAWLHARDTAVEHTMALYELGIHKQITNRLLEPFMWHTAIVSATDWDNFFKLRCAGDAHPEIRKLALLMREVLAKAEPMELEPGSWHLPLVTDEERASLDNEVLRKLSTGRCARVSYLNHEGKRDPEADIELHNRLSKSGHMSPFEHVATPAEGRHRNFNGWMQYREMVDGD